MKKAGDYLLPICKVLGYLGVYLAANVISVVACTVIMIFVTHSIDIYAGQEEVTSQLMKQAAFMTFVGNTLFVAAIILFAAIRKCSFKKEFYINAVPGKKIILILLLGIALNFFVSNFMHILELSWPAFSRSMETYEQKAALISESPFIVSLLLSVVSAPITEELLLRCCIFTTLNKAYPAVLSVILTSVIFGLLHGNLIWSTYAAVFGIVLNVLFIRFNSLIASISMHFAFNIIGSCVPTTFDVSFPVQIIFTILLGIISAALFIIVMKKNLKSEIQPANA
ncbi:MAG: CPBP family intramembrane metalloprotease [Oscillospiraceae bacterium]|nr:CPBP family intramembrane metalloprotease [Oscillospiraceae bacterium]